MSLNRSNPLPRTMAKVLEDLADNPELGDVYTKSQSDTLLSGKAATAHTHTESQITDLGDYATSGELTTGLSGKMATWVAVPASASASGVAGSLAYEAGFLYTCVATDTWERVVTATWV